MDAEESNTDATTKKETVLQVKSRQVYIKSYDTFMSWRSKNKISSFSEDILLSYFKTLEFKPSSLWSEYSKLKSTLSLYHKTDMSKYRKLVDWLKQKSNGFEVKKAKTFTLEELDRFITGAPDLDFLQVKVAVIFGIMGACSRQELQKLECQDVIDTQNTLIGLIVNIMKAKKIDRTFAISGEYYDVCKKYMSLRPKCDNPRFFIRYSNGRCVNQNIGLNKFGAMGKLVAKVLKLPNPELYTGHCFRRTSVNLTDDGVNLLKKRGWQTAIAEQCDETNRRTTRSSKMDENNSLAPEKLRVAVIFGIMGACRRQELQKLECQNVVDTQNTLVVNIMKAKKIDRTFAISGEYYDVCKKYMSLRPKCDNPRFFIRYSNGRCVNQNVGINTFGAMGKLVAKVLKLPNPELYTGHCFKRTSVNLINDGDSLLKMTGCQTAVAEQCDETNLRTIRSSKMEDNSSLASEKLRMAAPEVPAGPSKIIYVKTIDPNASTKNPVDPLNRRSQRCRFCFQFSEECIPISPNYLAADKTTLAFNNIQVQLDYTDNFPNVVCKDCDVKLQIMYDFVKDVKAAQESLVNVEVEMEPRREDIEIEMVTVKTEYEDNDENDSPDEDDNDKSYDSPDEGDDEDSDKDTKEGILDSLTVSDTNFIKESVTPKRKNTISADNPKKAKVAESEYTEFVMDIKEEVVERNDTIINAGLDAGIDLTPSKAEFAKSALDHKMRSDGNS